MALKVVITSAFIILLSFIYGAIAVYFTVPEWRNRHTALAPVNAGDGLHHYLVLCVYRRDTQPGSIDCTLIHQYPGNSVSGGSKKKRIHPQGGWRYLELPTSHVPMATMPQRLYRLIEIPAHS